MIFTRVGGSGAPYARGLISANAYSVSLSRNPKQTPLLLLALLLLLLPSLFTLQKFVALVAFGDANAPARARQDLQRLTHRYQNLKRALSDFFAPAIKRPSSIIKSAQCSKACSLSPCCSSIKTLHFPISACKQLFASIR